MGQLKKQPLVRPGRGRGPQPTTGPAPAPPPPPGPPAPAFFANRSSSGAPKSATAPAPAPPPTGATPPPPKPPGGVVNDNWLATHQDAAKALTDLINSKNAGPGGKPMAVPTSLGPTPGGIPAPPPSPPPPTPLTRDQVIANQLGTDPGTGTSIRDTSNPNDPMYAAAQRGMADQLAQIRSRYGASGFGNSGREALAEGNATGAFGGQIASIGEQAYQNDAQRRLAATLGAQNLNLGAQGIQMQGQNALAQLGQALNSIGAGEQSPANLQALLALLGLTMGQTGTGGYSSTDVGGGYGQWGSGTNV